LDCFPSRDKKKLVRTKILTPNSAPEMNNLKSFSSASLSEIYDALTDAKGGVPGTI